MNKQNLSQIEPILVESISDGGQFVFYPSGISMLPTIVGGKDCVVLVEPKNLKKHDLVLYKRKNGQYVLHRITSIHNGKYTMCGDNQLYLEYGIENCQIIAKADEIRKQNGKIIDRDGLHSGILKISIKRFFKKATAKIKRTFKGEN